MKYIIIAIAISLTSGCALMDGGKPDGTIAGINYLDPAISAAAAYNPALASLLGELKTGDKSAPVVHPAASVQPTISYRYLGAERILLPNETIPFEQMQEEYEWRVIRKPIITPAMPIDLEEPSEGIEK